jgi:predicted RNase H-related nuclease YkuK (DUF458 family)
VWRTIRGERVSDVRQFVEGVCAEGRRLVDIGTDSMQLGGRTQFVTVLAIRNPGHGGRAVYRRETRPRIASLRERLLREAWLSVDLGLALNDVIPDDADLTIHVDANPVPRHRSSLYVQELTALVVSQGFRVALKPTAWAATCAADHLLRGLAERGLRAAV